MLYRIAEITAASIIVNTIFYNHALHALAYINRFLILAGY